MDVRRPMAQSRSRFWCFLYAVRAATKPCFHPLRFNNIGADACRTASKKASGLFLTFAFTILRLFVYSKRKEIANVKTSFKT